MKDEDSQAVFSSSHFSVNMEFSRNSHFFAMRNTASYQGPTYTYCTRQLYERLSDLHAPHTAVLISLPHRAAYLPACNT